jgi:hypothetical protein
MTEGQVLLIRALVLITGFVVTWFQLRWLLRAYRAERDRQAPECRSPRPLLLSAALIVFVALATVAGVYTARRIAVGTIAAIGIFEAIRRRLA